MISKKKCLLKKVMFSKGHKQIVESLLKKVMFSTTKGSLKQKRSNKKGKVKKNVM